MSDGQERAETMQCGCGYRFDGEALGAYGCANCCGDQGPATWIQAPAPARPKPSGGSGIIRYRHMRIRQSVKWGDFKVKFPGGRARFGTLEDVKRDVDAYWAGTLPPPVKRAARD